MILLQIVMVSLGTHLVKSHESQCRTNESQLKKRVLNLTCLGLYVTRQLMWRQTSKLFSTVYWNYNIVLLFEAQKRLKEVCVVKQRLQQQPQKSHEQDILQKYRSIDQSLRSTGRMPWIILRLWGFLCVRDADAEVTKSLLGRKRSKATESIL